ncbi:MAG: Dihydroxyacetone kinase [Pseudomonadota bacterium]
MKKLINQIDTLLSDSLEGFALAHHHLIELHRHPYFIRRLQPTRQGKVALISGGGSGHEPLHIGFVGTGMLDAACPGQIFTSPTPDQMLAAATAVENGGGVLFIVKNYAGDVMNFEIAAEMLDCPQASVLVADDVALPKNHSIGRRGIAGTLIMEKILGAAAERGIDLTGCVALANQLNQSMASMGLALTSCTVPALGQPTFNLAADEIEMGVGIHGEAGRHRQLLTEANLMIEQLMEAIVAEFNSPINPQSVLLHVNGYGATPLMELYLVYQIAFNYLQQRGIKVIRSLVGNYTTALDMAGCSITVCILNQTLIELWDDPVKTAHLHW